MKVLFVATVRSHIGQFHMPFIRALKSDGYTVDAAFKDNSDIKPGLDLTGFDNIYEVPFERSPYRPENIKAYRVLKKIIDNGNYDIVHCHTPMGAVVTRLAARVARKRGTKVFYTAHGFHFFKGAPKKNWILYFPMEKYLSKYTDLLININQEDYDLAHKKKFSAKNIEKINGVGVDLTKFANTTEEEKIFFRNKYGFGKEKFILFYAADLCHGKNQAMIFKAMSQIKNQCPNLLLILPGQQTMLSEYQKMCEELGISEMVKFLGYRRDIDSLLATCDCVVSTSRREGLPVNLIEAAARGKYIIATNVRGNADVVNECEYGSLVELDDFDSLAIKLSKLYTNGVPELIGEPKVKGFEVETIVNKLLELYTKYK